jgi:hypothetical protein
MGIFQNESKGFQGGKYLGVITDDLLDDLAGVMLNAVTSYEEGYTSQATEHAVEEGAPITDNVFNNPMGLSISAILSDSNSVTAGASVVNTKTVRDRVNQLLSWREQKTLLYFSYNNETHEEMILTEVKKTRSKDMGNGIALAITMKKIKIATATTGNKKGLTEKIENTQVVF